MFRWAYSFFIIALVAGLLGFSKTAGAFSDIVVILFWIFFALFLISILVSLVIGEKRNPRA